MMTEEEIYKRLNTIYRDIFDDEPISLTSETTADDIAGWDSFNHINIVVATEVAFGVKFKSAEIEGLKNVGDFVRLIQKSYA